MRLDSPCPACGVEGIKMSTATTDIPYFGDCMETLVRCDACGFKHTDFLVLGEKEPVRFSLEVGDEAHLFARVVRSTSGTIRIPEFGVLVEPGPLAESFVTNVEGVLGRVEAVLGQLSRSGNEEQKGKALALIQQIEQGRRGQMVFTLVLEDPLGNSVIAHPDAVRTELSPEEASRLKTGMTFIDVDDLVEDEGGDDDDDEGGVPSVDELLRP
jgi:zinc finger protein